MSEELGLLYRISSYRYIIILLFCYYTLRGCIAMSANSTVDENVTNTAVSSSMAGNQTDDYPYFFNIIHSVGFFVAMVGVLIGCFVINIVIKLSDNDLRSRFALLCVLICDVIQAVSNLSKVIFVFILVDRERFQSFYCHFVLINLMLTNMFSIPLALSLLCLAVDQVIAVFKPFYFRTTEGTKRKIIYVIISFSPVPVVSAILIYMTVDAIESSVNGAYCLKITEAFQELIQYVIIFVIPLAISTPMIYAVVLWKISGQRCGLSENALEKIQNRRLVISFLFLSASYMLLWIPTLAYFTWCYNDSDSCWKDGTTSISLLVHIIYITNYIVDPITCAVRMEPVKQRILQLFSRG